MGNKTNSHLTIIAALGFGLLAAASSLNAGQDSVELLPHWTKGEKLNYEIVKTFQKSQGDKVTQKTSARSDLEIEVLSASKDNFIVAWTLGEIRFDDPDQAKNPLVPKMANLLKDYRLILVLNSEGTIQGVQNWEDVKQEGTKRLDLLTEELKDAGVDQATVTKLRGETASMFATKQQVEQFCTRDPQIFFLPLGVEFSGGKPVEFEDKLPNPLGGESFPSQATFALSKVDKETGIAKVSWIQTVASAKARRIMEKTVKDLAQRVGKPIPDADALKTLTVGDTAEFRIELSTGWIQSLTHKRLTRMEGTSQEDAIIVTRKKT